MPVGPHILCPENARKSQPNSCTSSGMWPALCAASTRVSCPHGTSLGAKFGDAINCAERIGDMREREKFYFWC